MFRGHRTSDRTGRADFLKFLERGRSEYLGSKGRPIQDWNRTGYNFVVRALSMKFKRPGRLGDLLDVVTSFRLESPFRARFNQRLECQGKLLVQAEIDVVCIDAWQRLIEFPSI